MLGSIGVVELLILVFMAIVVIWPAWRILGKAGFASWLGILAVIPVVNFGLFLFLAFAEWPVERDLRALRGSNPEPSAAQR